MLDFHFSIFSLHKGCECISYPQDLCYSSQTQAISSREGCTLTPTSSSVTFSVGLLTQPGIAALQSPFRGPYPRSRHRAVATETLQIAFYAPEFSISSPSICRFISLPPPLSLGLPKERRIAGNAVQEFRLHFSRRGEKHPNPI